ncbi:hypothetical protein J31TS4_05380 [Paenibacillus sp. J31TS4]|uniref:GNAT family N-acetyltransferase n=1 Tax=Paenibacillus sp. J31TS4 TaxID=2807195 RepID=UPI001B25B3AE|nr:GNAT family N-acetyltransferase [Paenibacillus sp. J31TS4]GIP37258.1 hypothetical protein J31TS4_05380 [Paenibacillus sp. J31TS4]
MESIQIRSIHSREELLEVYRLLDGCFPVGQAYFQSRLDHDTAYSMETTWVAVVDGVIASTVQLFPYPFRVGSAELLAGGIGSVGTLEAYRGRGLSSRILEALTRWMERSGYDLSVLFAVIHPFYEKAGWTIVPEPKWKLDVQRLPVDAPAPEDCTVQAIRPEDHLPELGAVYDAFNRERTLTRIRPPAYWRDMLHWQASQGGAWSAAFRSGRMIAYGRLDKERNGISQLAELCYLPGEAGAALPVLYHLAGQLPAVRLIEAKLPGDHVLLPYLREWGAQEEEFRYAMWKLISLPSIGRKLQPLLEKRLEGHSVPSFDLTIRCDGQALGLSYRKCRLYLSDNPPGADACSVNLGQAELVAMLLQGYRPEMQMEGEFRMGGCEESTVRRLLAALFPEQPFVYSPFDKF